jgi:hypothetical protein
MKHADREPSPALIIRRASRRRRPQSRNARSAGGQRLPIGPAPSAAGTRRARGDEQSLARLRSPALHSWCAGLLRGVRIAHVSAKHARARCRDAERRAGADDRDRHGWWRCGTVVIPSEPQCRGRSSFTVVSGIRQNPSDRGPVCYQACRAAAGATSGVLPYRIRSMRELGVNLNVCVVPIRYR